MLSLPKIALTLVIIITVIFGYRLLNQLRKRPKADDRSEVLDLSKCSACGKYVDKGDLQCLRGDCPFT